MAFSPDGKYLVYLLSAEGNSSGGALQATLLDTATGQKTPLNLGQHYFTQWLRDSSGFLAQDSNQRMVIYRLNGLQAPTSITPAGFTDLYPTLSPDGKFLAVVSVPVAQAGAQAVANNVFLMGLDGSNRRQLTQFNDLQQVITGLFWGSDGIYYSLYTGESMDKVFRMDLDGQNPTEVASGTLQGIVGLR